MGSDLPVPFARRFGFAATPLIFEDFPKSARMGLWFVLSDLADRGYIDGSWNGLQREVERSARARLSANKSMLPLVEEMPWTSVYVLIERIAGLLTDSTITVGEDQLIAVPLDQVRQHYHREINQLLGEEGIGYELRDGVLARPGRPSTQKTVARVAQVLADPRLVRAGAHYRKALKFFGSGPGADHENTIKEAVAALEAAAKGLLDGQAAELLPDRLRRHQGTTADKIPPTLVKAMGAVFAFRGAADGVAHGGADGGVATPEVAEWVLSQVAAHITYLADFKRSLEDEVPF